MINLSQFSIREILNAGQLVIREYLVLELKFWMMSFCQITQTKYEF